MRLRTLTMLCVVQPAVAMWLGAEVAACWAGGATVVDTVRAQGVHTGPWVVQLARRNGHHTHMPAVAECNSIRKKVRSYRQQ